MKNFKNWISSQLVSNSLLSVRPFSFFDVEAQDGDSNNQVPTDVSVSGSIPVNTHSSSSQMIGSQTPQLAASDSSQLVQYSSDDKTADPLTKVESLQIKFLRLVHRIGHTPDNLVVAQVLYRLQLASLIRSGESGTKRHGLKVDKAIAIASQLEAADQADVNFSFKILVLGKTGVGKSAFINSIFEQMKAETDAFQPATDRIQEVVGIVRGIKVTVIDTPGLLPYHANQRRNRKILLKVRRFTRRSPPDIVLYFERLDIINRGYNDYPLLKLITNIFGSSMWFNTILVMTHASSHPPEGPDGYPVSYDMYVGHCRNIVQHYIHQAVSSAQLETPLLLVENHSLCRRNTKGEKVLPNGQVWLSQFLLLCIATKVLADTNSLLKFQDTFRLSQNSTRLPSLPHLLSSLLRPRSLSSSSGFDDEVDDVSDLNEDEYDQLPPIRILTKSQFQKLSRTQREAYLDELDYRETLFLKKQWKEELRRRKETKLPNEGISDNDNYENDVPTEAVQLPDVAIPSTFDSDNPVYRYRCLMHSDQWLVRPVLDSHGWDHDVGFDGINLESSLNIKTNLHASVVGQMSKDKVDFSIQSECSAKYMDPKGHSVLAGINIQTAGKDLVCTVCTDGKFKNLHCNRTGGGLSLTSFGNNYFIGAKLEDSISIGTRLMLTMNTGRVSGCGQVAHGGSLEATLRGKDYPARDDKVTVASTLLSFDKEMVFSGSLQSDFRVSHGAKMSINANLNSRQMGQVCLKTSTTEHIEIALIAIVSMFQALLKRRTIDAVDR